MTIADIGICRPPQLANGEPLRFAIPLFFASRPIKGYFFPCFKGKSQFLVIVLPDRTFIPVVPVLFTVPGTDNDHFFGILNVNNGLPGYVTGLNSRKGSNFSIVVMGFMSIFIFETSRNQNIDGHLSLLSRDNSAKDRILSRINSREQFENRLKTLNADGFPAFSCFCQALTYKPICCFV